MQNSFAWTAFLVMAFLVCGLAGLFGSYATSIPLERALMRSAVLDQVLVAAQQADGLPRLEALRPALGDSAARVLSGPGDLPARVADARRTILTEQEREARSVGARIRLMIGVVTVLAAALGAGLLAIAARGARKESA